MGRRGQFQARYSAEQWAAVKADVLGGLSIAKAAAKHGMNAGSVEQKAFHKQWGVWERRCIQRGKERLGKCEAGTMRKALREMKVEQIEFEVAHYGERLRKAGLRTRRAIAEVAEELVEALRREPEMAVLERSRALQAVANVCKIVHGWDREQGWERDDPLQSAGGINLGLVRLSPEQIRNWPRPLPLQAGGQADATSVTTENGISPQGSSLRARLAAAVREERGKLAAAVGQSGGPTSSGELPVGSPHQEAGPRHRADPQEQQLRRHVGHREL
jgi:hypothetical protein